MSRPEDIKGAKNVSNRIVRHHHRTGNHGRPGLAAFSGEWQGGASGAGICVIANLIEEIGGGVSLHKHPYADIFVVRKGAVSFTLGSGTIEGREGQIIVVPGGVPHAFRNSGPGPLEMIDIHKSGAFITEWLE